MAEKPKKDAGSTRGVGGESGGSEREMTLAQRILAARKTGKGFNPRLNKAAFVAVKDEVQDSLNQGLSAREIHAYFLEEGTLSCTYQTFLSYCRAEGVRKQRDPEQPKAGRTKAARPKGPSGIVKKLDLDEDDVV